MGLSCRVLCSGFVLAAGLMLGCGESGGGKPMKGETIKPGNESAADRETKTNKGGKKPQPGVPEGPEMPDSLKK